MWLFSGHKEEPLHIYIWYSFSSSFFLLKNGTAVVHHHVLLHQHFLAPKIEWILSAYNSQI